MGIDDDDDKKRRVFQPMVDEQREGEHQIK
jgi:hypothetical protein